MPADSRDWLYSNHDAPLTSLHDLIHDLFEYSRMRHDAIPMRRTALNLVEMINQLLVHHHLALGNANMSGRLITSHKELMVVGDPDRLGLGAIELRTTNEMLPGQRFGTAGPYTNRDFMSCRSTLLFQL